MRAGDDASGRPRQDGVNRLSQRGLDRHQPAGRLHHHDGRVASEAEPCFGIVQSRGQRAEVARHDGCEIGVQHCRAGALELAELAQNVRRDADGDARQMPLQHRLGGALVRGVGVGVQEGDGHRLDAPLAHVGGGLDQLGPIERLDLPPVVVHAPDDPVAQLARHQRRNAHHVDVVEARAVLPPDQKQVPETVVGDEGGPGAAALDDGVGGRRHAVADVGDGAARQAQLPQRSAQAVDGAHVARPGRRRHFRDGDAPRPRIVGNAVGERAADVGSDPNLHVLST